MCQCWAKGISTGRKNANDCQGKRQGAKGHEKTTRDGYANNTPFFKC